MKDQALINFLINNMKSLKFMDIEDTIKKLEDQRKILEILPHLKENYPYFSYCTIIKNIKNEDIRLEVLTALSKNIKFTAILESTLYTFKDENIRFYLIKKYISRLPKNDPYYMKDLTDLHKEQLLERISNKLCRVKVINSFENDDLKLKYAFTAEYSIYTSMILNTVTDKEKVINAFKQIPSFHKKHVIAYEIVDKELKEKLYKIIGGSELHKFRSIAYGRNMIIPDAKIKENVDKSITIGVELECCHSQIDLYKDTSYLLDYEITDDPSLMSGLELRSPILHYTKKDLNKLKFVCDTLEDTGFYTDSLCGGHIHLGSKYLITRQDLVNFLNIYTNSENIIYTITNKAGRRIRSGINGFAYPIKDLIIQSKEHLDIISDKEAYINTLKAVIGSSRFTAVNFTNIGDPNKDTIEFRMPNGEINFKEVNANIKLFTSLFEASRKDKEELEILSSKLKEEQRLLLLLDLIFKNDEDKDIYLERYYENKDLEKDIYISNKTLSLK